MNQRRRNSVFVAPHGTIGQELVFRHYTSKVVAAKHPDDVRTKAGKLPGKGKINLKGAKAYAREIMKHSELKLIYEAYLEKGEKGYQKAMQNYFGKAIAK